MADPVDLNMGLSHERLLQVLNYNPDTGEFTWAISRPKCVKGKIAGCLRSDGGWRLRVDGFLYAAHRLAWFYVHGEWPREEIDHINRIRSDNRLVNLRAATRLQNQINVVLHNKNGYSNVDKIGKRYRARAKIGGVHIHLGMADTASEAHAISVRERRKVHGEFVVSQIGEI